MADKATTYHRRPTRLKKFDYSSPGAYFVTIVSHNRMNIFGSISNGEVQLSQVGVIVDNTWREIPSHFPLETPDVYIIMPNHFHGILTLHDPVEATHDSFVTMPNQIHGITTPVEARLVFDSSTLCASPLPAKRHPLGVIVGSFKSTVTKRVHDAGLYVNKKIWQRNYYDHVIRDEDDYYKICEYIEHNPVNWECDEENHA